MKSMRVLCWAWIVASTIVILFQAPVSVTRQDSKSRPQVTRIEWIGPFGEPLRRYDVTKSSIDFSRLFVALLAVNFLPATLLWRHNEVAGWLERQQRHPVTIDQARSNEMLDRARARRGIAFFKTILVALLFIGGLGIYSGIVHTRPKSKSDSPTQTSPIDPVKSPPTGASIPSPTSVSDFDWASAKEVTPPSKSLPAAAPKIPDGWRIIDPTPTPVRRAIPIAPESRR